MSEYTITTKEMAKRMISRPLFPFLAPQTLTGPGWKHVLFGLYLMARNLAMVLAKILIILMMPVSAPLLAHYQNLLIVRRVAEKRKAVEKLRQERAQNRNL